MVSYYGLNLKFCCEVLSSLNKIVILPTNYKFSDDCALNVIDMKSEREKWKEWYQNEFEI